MPKLVERRAILTFPGDMGKEECWPTGKRITEIQDKRLRDALRSMANVWIDRLELDGEEYYDMHDIHVYGPFPSRELLEPLMGKEHYTASDRDKLQLIKTIDPNPVYAHYVLNANFLVGEPSSPLHTYRSC